MAGWGGWGAPPGLVPSCLPANVLTLPHARLPRCSPRPPTRPLPFALFTALLPPPCWYPSAWLQVSPVLDDPLARRAVGPKKISKAAQSQESMTFQDAWAAKNGRVVDVWAVIGVLFIIVPPAVIIWALSTGVIPGLV